MVPSCSKQRLWNECAPVNLAATAGERAQVCTGATACGQRAALQINADAASVPQVGGRLWRK